nr:MAG TPA: chromosome partition protein [Caudoviricetes sp.]
MNIELKKLTLSNFKGIKDLIIDFSNETNIYGDNATGKTTAFDSFTWLLFGKDSANRADFNVKTLDDDGNVIHGLEHTVEGILTADGKEILLKRVLKENWVKKRGSAESIFSGNTTDYFINEAPRKEKEYKEYINSLIDESIFKLLTNPMYFNTVLSWQDRRKVLLDIVGDITDQDVIASTKELSKLETLLKGNTIDDFKAIAASNKKKINEQLKTIPIRIDEINRGLPVLADDIDYDGLEKERAKIKGDMDYLSNALTNQEKIAQEFTKKQSEISSAKMKLKDMELRIEKNSMQSLNDLKMKLLELEHEAQMLEKGKNMTEETLESNEREIEKLQKEMEAYREDYKVVFEEPFPEPDRDNFICPTCKQKLPEDNVEKQISGLLANFKSNKLKKLEEINKQGKWRKTKAAELQKENDRLKLQIEKDVARQDELLKNIKNARNALKTEESREHTVNYDTDPEYSELKQKIAAEEKNLLPLEQDSRVRQQYNDLQDELQKINEVLSSKKAIADAQERIKELKSQERSLAVQVAELEGHEYLAETFIKTKVNLLEEKINSTFKYVTFKMFDVQVNGGISETCQALVNGVPFADANNAAKINAGLDIINALGKYYDTTCPVFIDNREAVNRLIETESQVINLIVSKDKSLRVEAA